MHQPPAHLVGHVDHVSDGIVRGWAFDAKRPKVRLQLDAFWRGIFLGRASTGLLREDLRANGIGDGHHAFVFHLPEDVPADLICGDIAVVAAGPGHRFALPLSPRLAPDRGATIVVETGVREMLAPFVAATRAFAVGADATAPAARGRIDALCAPDRDLGTSAFVAHVARKYERPECATGEVESLWRWYLGTYALERGPRRAPLSRDDIAALRALVPALLGAEIGRRGRAYRWAMEASRRLFVEDCLVPRRQLARLGRIRVTDALRAYPLSAAMRQLRRKTIVLRDMPVARADERRRLYAAIMILALREPHLLQVVPRLWLDRLLDEVGTLEATLIALFGGGFDGARYRALLARTCFDPASMSFARHFERGHRVRGVPMLGSPEEKVDIQLFGPVGRRMGLGESCRRIAAALRDTPFTLNVVDYDLGNAAPRDDAPAGRPRAARLNILHLNLEEIPEAIAYLPDAFSGAPLVAIPFWELDTPAAVHRLGANLADELWVASGFLAEVFAGCGTPVHRIGMSAAGTAVPSLEARQALRARLDLSPDTFVVLTTSDALSWVQRKNPLGVVEAFRAAFPGDERVALVVKTHNLHGPLSATQRAHWDAIADICRTDHRVRLVGETFDADAQRTLLAACDALASLHRAEGLGLDVLDALALGTPVVATAYSGTLEFCNGDTAWLVPAQLRAVAPADYCFVEPGHRWAEPDAEAARAALRGVYSDVTLRAKRVAAGQALIAGAATRQALAHRLEANVRRLLGA